MTHAQDTLDMIHAASTAMADAHEAMRAAAPEAPDQETMDDAQTAARMAADDCTAMAEMVGTDTPTGSMWSAIGACWRAAAEADTYTASMAATSAAESMLDYVIG